MDWDKLDRWSAGGRSEPEWAGPSCVDRGGERAGPAWRLLVALATCVRGSKGTCGSTEEAGMDRRPQEAPGDNADRQEVRGCVSKPAHQQQADAKVPQRF
jgi:hypothetical protein